MKKIEEDILIICLYVNDLLVTWSNMELMNKIQDWNGACLWNDKPRKNALLPRNGSTPKEKSDCHLLAKICQRNYEEMQNGGMQTNVYSYEPEREVLYGRWYWKGGWTL